MAWVSKLNSNDDEESEMGFWCSSLQARREILPSIDFACIPHGILLISNLFDKRPVIQYIPLPYPGAFITDEGGNIYHPQNVSTMPPAATV